MAKKKKSTKKSLLIASLALIVVFTLSLVVMAVVPYSATAYTYKTEDSKTTYVFKKGEFEKTSPNIITGKYSTDSYDYTIEKNDEGQYVVKPEILGGISWESGTINAYEFKIGDTVYKNGFTCTWRIISIVGISLGGVGVVLYFVLGNKKTSKKRK